MSGTMKALVRRGNGLQMAEIAEPVPGPGQVIVRSLACGICGSDLHAVHHLDHIVETSRRSGAATTIDSTKDLVLGHEFCAEILDYGPDTERRFKPGTHVVSVPATFGPDGSELIGFSTRYNGAFAERLLLTEALCLEVPNGLPPERAALTEPLAVGTHAVAVGAPGPKSVAMVVGCGPVGLAVIVALKRRGVGPVIAADFSPTRRARAEKLGADIVVDPAAVSPHAHWSSFDVPATLAELSSAALAGRDLRDAIVFECVGVPGMLQNLIDHAPPMAHIVVVGVCMEDDRILPLVALNKQLRMSFAFGYSPEEFAETLRALAEGEVDSDQFLTDSVSLADAAEAFERLAAPGDQVKIIVEPGR